MNHIFKCLWSVNISSWRAKRFLLSTVIQFAFLFTLTIAGCANYSANKTQAVTENKKTKIDSLTKKISNYGIGIVKRRNYIAFVLPSQTFFVHRSANFTKDTHKVLNLILNLSKCYEISDVSVIGFSKFKASYDLSNSITHERARKTAQYLRDWGINTTFMYSNAMDTSLVKNNKLFPEDFIVIKFR